MSEFSLEPLNITPAEFVRSFFDPAERVCLRVFSDKPDSAFSGQKLECEMWQFDDYAKILKAHNEQGRGVYFVINYGGHEDADIKRINAHFMECDNISLEEQLSQIQAFSLEPSLIVKTRKSLHCYWLIRDGKTKNFRRVQRKLAMQFNADPACINENRVFRVPGFYHCKEEPMMVECVKFNPEIRYSQAELESTLPDIPNDSEYEDTYYIPSPVRDRGTQKGLTIVGRSNTARRMRKRSVSRTGMP